MAIAIVTGNPKCPDGSFPRVVQGDDQSLDDFRLGIVEICEDAARPMYQDCVMVVEAETARAEVPGGSAADVRRERAAHGCPFENGTSALVSGQLTQAGGSSGRA